MKHFPTAGHLCSWAAMCPGQNESAGKRRSGRPAAATAICAPRSFRQVSPRCTRTVRRFRRNITASSAMLGTRRPCSPSAIRSLRSPSLRNASSRSGGRLAIAARRPLGRSGVRSVSRLLLVARTRAVAPTNACCRARSFPVRRQVSFWQQRRWPRRCPSTYHIGVPHHLVNTRLSTTRKSDVPAPIAVGRFDRDVVLTPLLPY